MSRPRAALKPLFLARDAGGPFGSPAAAQSSPGRPGGVPVPSSARLPTQHAPGPRTPGAVPSAPPRPKARASRHHPRAPCAQAPVTTWEPSGWAPAPMSPPARAWQSGKPGIGISRRRGKRWRRKAVARQQRPREEVTSNSPGLSGTQHRLSACVARTTAQTEGSDVTGVGVGSSVP